MNYSVGQKLNHESLGAVLVVEFFGVDVRDACPVSDPDLGMGECDNANGKYFVPQ